MAGFSVTSARQNSADSARSADRGSLLGVGVAFSVLAVDGNFEPECRVTSTVQRQEGKLTSRTLLLLLYDLFSRISLSRS